MKSSAIAVVAAVDSCAVIFQPKNVLFGSPSNRWNADNRYTACLQLMNVMTSVNRQFVFCDATEYYFCLRRIFCVDTNDDRLKWKKMYGRRLKLTSYHLVAVLSSFRHFHFDFHTFRCEKKLFRIFSFVHSSLLYYALQPAFLVDID